MSELDIIVPVYNEAETLKELFLRLDKSLTEAKIDYKVIFVDDNSTDNTAEIVESLPTSRVQLLMKRGKRGKAYSILEGYEVSRAPYIAMIDGDLEYPPEALPEMFKKMETNGAVVAHRDNSHGSVLRKLGSKLNRAIFGRIMLGFNCDVQSGLKMFRREIFTYFDKKKTSAWAIDMPLLYITLELGYTIGEVNIKFSSRTKGASKLKSEFLSASFQIASTALRLRRCSQKIYRIPGESEDSNLGTGVVHKRKRYITHTALPSHLSSLITLSAWQKYAIFLVLILIGVGFILAGKTTAIILVGVLTCIYFLDVLFNLFLVLKSLHFPPEIGFSEDQLAQIKDSSLPVYSILCPLYKEAHILPQFVEAINALDWPKNKLEVLLLLEEDDKLTIEAAKAMDLPSHFKVLVIPHSFPKTKPKACNYGLIHSKGEYVVIYDAEDRPDPLQLKKAYLAFKSSPEKVVCLQAKLNYYNPHQNLLTRLFTAEYSLWFDMVLPGLQSINTAIPLGGTSNHFKTSVLKSLQGWDAFNVTEDCDLGARLFKAGYTTSIIDSTTLEEANSRVGNWFRQRSRWIKGYIQTYLVHNRNPIEFIRTHGIHAFIFQLVVGGKIAFMVINPFLWVATILYFTLYSIFGPTIESLYPASIFYMAVTSLVFGNFLFLYYYMIGAAKRGHWALIKYIYFIPIYWLAVSLAAFKAFGQLIIKPHYWEKTNHGLDVQKVQAAVAVAPKPQSFNQQIVVSGGILVFATILANFLNFLGSTFLTRSTSISFEELGVLGFIGSITAISDVIFGAISKTITYKTAFLLGKHNRVIKNIWKLAFNFSLVLGLAVSALWFGSVPFLSKFFASPALPLLITAPVWFFTVITAINSGFLSGAHKFAALAGFLVIEAITKLVATFGLVYIGRGDLVYLALPISLAVSAIFGIAFILLLPKHEEDASLEDAKKVPSDFFFSSIALKAAGVLFLSMDVIIAKHFLDPVSAGHYVLLSTIGKMVYFFGSLFTGFINPLVSRNEGAEKSSSDVFDTSLILTVLANIVPIVFIGILGGTVIPILFSTKGLSVTTYLFTYTLAMSFFSIAGVVTGYHLAKKHYIFSVTSLFIAIGQSLALIFQVHSISNFVSIIVIASAAHLIGVLVLHLFYNSFISVFENLHDFLLVLRSFPFLKTKPNAGKRILILNWRDTKHAWAGGAEVYIQELAKRWVTEGNQVVLFSGHDRRTSRNENIDGVEIIRRGGFVFVYVWSCLYYLVHFRSKFDVIIDCTNGLPFFTPIYSKTKKFLLIHHVNQDIFRQGLPWPLYHIAWFLEAKLMPWVYRKVQVITVSESSKKEIVEYKLTKSDPIVIHNGVDLDFFTPGEKSKVPMVLYLGRLQKHKSVQVFIQAAKKILETKPEIEFVIAGDGPDKDSLAKLVSALGLTKKIKFAGRVLEEEKRELYRKAWVFVNPSMMEGWGITSIEANACGTPVVASNVPGLRDSVKNPHTGFLVAYGDENAFADRILRLIEDTKLRCEMSTYAVVWAKNFGWESSAKAFREAIGI